MAVPDHIQKLMEDVQSGKMDDLTVRELKIAATQQSPFKDQVNQAASIVSVVVLIIFGDAPEQVAAGPVE